MNEKIKENQLKLFNKLFSTLPAVKRINTEKSILHLKKPITHIYFFHNKKFWFGNGETDEKYIFIFGKNPEESDIGESDATLIIDFDKDTLFNDNSLGLFSVENSELHILINDILLNQRYPYFNTGDFQIREFHSLNNNLTLNVIDLGDLNNDFIDNIEQFIGQSPKINQTPNFQEIGFKPQVSKKQIEETQVSDEISKKMNLFINSLEAGKDIESAYNIAKIDSETVENWYKLGKKGNENYIYFFEKYKPYNPKIVEKNKKIEIFLDNLKKNPNIDDALKNANLTMEKVRAWYNLGEKGDKDYKDFYLRCKVLLPQGIPKNNSKKIVNNEELINEFITLIEDGNTNSEAIKKLKIPKFKVKNWINQGKLGNKKYENFYNTYMKEIEKEKQIKKSKKQETLIKETKKDTNLKNEEESISKNENDKSTSGNTCKICGRKLNKKSNKDLCKRCLRKQYASKIILKLLKSIQPEKPFKKDDLKVLGLQNIQITDYIWTLQEFNLITKKNNKFKLKNKKELEKFIKESGLNVEKIPQDQNVVKLHKTCKTCGKTLEISKFFTSENTSDGFEDNCKDCKRLITTASYLKEIIEFIPYGSEFRDEDLKTHFKNPFQLQAKIWALQDSDLVKKNFETETYTLTDEITVQNFLNKYYHEKDEKQINSNNSAEETEQKNPKDYTKWDKMKLVIQSIKEGKSKKEAAEIANIPLYKITHWYNEGRQGYGADNVYFFNQLKGIEKINQTKNKSLKNKMDKILDDLRKNPDIHQNPNINENEINEWIEKGKNNIEPYKYFFEQYDIIKVNQHDMQELEYNNKQINRKIFLENFKSGKTKEESAKNSQLDLSLIHEWYLKGQNNEKPYIKFYEEYIKIRDKSKSLDIPKITNSGKFGTERIVNQMNVILESMTKGMDESEALKTANISNSTYQYWLNRGKQEFGEIYIEFYRLINKIKDNALNKSFKQNNIDNKASNENDFNKKLEVLLTPLDEKYEILFTSSKMNKTGIAWVTITRTQWIYQKSHENHTITLSNPNIYELYLEVKNNNLPWGTRDQNIAKPLILKYFDLTPDEDDTPKINENEKSENIDFGIYAPLPEKYEEAFKSNPMNRSGIAWVNKSGNYWTYEKRINGVTIQIKDNDIYKLYEKVKDSDNIWGIRDYTKAKKIIDIPDRFIIHETKKPIQISEKIPAIIDPDIYAPLPAELTSTFNPSQSNKTGIAWVNQSGSNWRYSRKVNGHTFEEVDENIYELHKKIKNRNLDWGIKDYEKAKKIIKIPNDYQPPIESKEINEINTDIFAPLPEKYKITFNPKQPNKTGIAWVNQTGTKWTYQRVVDGITIRFSDSNIKKLHEIVINNNHIWGIVDFEKAKYVINENKIKLHENDENIIKNDVTVNFIKVNDNETDIIVKGVIKNYELIKILNKLDMFETDFKRIITNSIYENVDLFIELEINDNLISTFIEKIDDLNWKINK